MSRDTETITIFRELSLFPAEGIAPSTDPKGRSRLPRGITIKERSGTDTGQSVWECEGGESGANKGIGANVGQCAWECEGGEPAASIKHIVADTA